MFTVRYVNPPCQEVTWKVHQLSFDPLVSASWSVFADVGFELQVPAQPAEKQQRPRGTLIQVRIKPSVLLLGR